MKGFARQRSSLFKKSGQRITVCWQYGVVYAYEVTSGDDRELLLCLRLLKGTHAGTGFMHEAFEKDDPKKFTRAWFAWANTLFDELVLKLYEERPHLLKLML